MHAAIIAGNDTQLRTYRVRRTARGYRSSDAGEPVAQCVVKLAPHAAATAAAAAAADAGVTSGSACAGGLLRPGAGVQPLLCTCRGTLLRTRCKLSASAVAAVL